jgi:hypothetical protein
VGQRLSRVGPHLVAGPELMVAGCPLWEKRGCYMRE